MMKHVLTLAQNIPSAKYRQIHFAGDNHTRIYIKKNALLFPT
jgi:hypothetical protein